MKGKLHIYALTLLLSAGSVAVAQDIKNFSGDPVIFLSEVESYFNKFPPVDRSNSQVVLNNLKQMFTGGIFTSSHQLSIIGISNQMLVNGYRPQPSFVLFYSGLMAYKTRYSDLSGLEGWLRTVEQQVVLAPARQLQKYLEFSVTFFRNRILSGDTGYKWLIRAERATFVADTTPAVRFSDASISCVSVRDSIVINEATGTYYPLYDLWIGNKGRVNLKRREDQLESWISLLSYKIQTRRSSYRADTAILTLPKYFRQPVIGSFSDQLNASNPASGSMYPKFRTFSHDHIIRNVFENISFQGGFSVEGDQYIGWGLPEKSATVIIITPFKSTLYLRSASFVFRDGQMNSGKAVLSLHFEGDSIYHPQLSIRYNDEEKTLMMMRMGEGIARNGFLDSYHKLDIYTDAVSWKLPQAYMEFGAILSFDRSNKALFRSSNAFNTEQYLDLIGIEKVNPAVTVYNFSRNRRSNFFNHELLTAAMKLDHAQIVALLIKLANLGLVDFTPQTGTVRVLDRMKHYVDAYNKKADYDVIELTSEVKDKINARLDLKSFELRIIGLSQVRLSSQQNVVVYPVNNEILVKKNRDFTFAGRIEAGLFVFNASQAAFIYDKFKFSLSKIDSITFKVPVPVSTPTEKQNYERVRTILSDLSGEVLISHPNNKSGLQIQPQYPKFVATTESYVYFDQPHIQKGVYRRDKFYFLIRPFTIDSLNSFTTQGIRFNGYLFSSGLLPEIKEPLMVQKDYSLGLIHKIPTAGIPLYDGKGRLYGDLSLSTDGLKGKGKVECLSASVHSMDILMHPDSLMAAVDDFSLGGKAKPGYLPDVQAKNITQVWIPGSDMLKLQSGSNDWLYAYQNQAVIKGGVRLRPDSLTTDGTIEINNARFSGTAVLDQSQIKGKGSVQLSTTEGKIYFRTTGATFSYDTQMRQGIFGLDKPEQYAELPVSQYRTNLTSYRWEPDYKELYITSEQEELLHKGRSNSFASTNPGQGGLGFAAGSARYDIFDHTLYIDEVKSIHSGDALIVPGNGKLTIGADARIDKLKQAQLIADTTNKFHRIYDAEVEILSGKAYQASGTYYIPVGDSRMQPVFFQKIAPGTDGVSSGTASIADAPLAINNHFTFRGDLSFNGNVAGFTYNGAYSISNPCLSAPAEWVRFSGQVNPEDVRLPVTDPLKSLAGEPLAAAMVLGLGNQKIYPAFLGKKELNSDQSLTSVAGTISEDPKLPGYIIRRNTGSMESDAGIEWMSLNTDKCIVKAKGLIDLGGLWGQFKIISLGDIEHHMINDSTTLNIFVSMDFYFAAEAMKLMAGKINSFNLKGVEIGSTHFFEGLKELAGIESARMIDDELKAYGTFRRFPQNLPQKMILSELKMKWNKITRSLTSVGPIGVFSVNGNFINKYVPGHVEIVRRRSGDIINVYLEPDRNEWYFFSYSTGVMQAVSSNQEFNNMIYNLKEQKRKLKTVFGQEPYQFIISSAATRNAFLRRMRAN